MTGASLRTGNDQFAPLLGRGPHLQREDGACVMEYVAWLAGEPHSDRPECVHPLLAAVAQVVNDGVSDARRAALARRCPEFIGTATDDPEAWCRLVDLVCRHGLAVAPPLWTAQLQHALRIPAARFAGTGMRARIARRRSESAVRAATAAIVMTAPRSTDRPLLRLVEDSLRLLRRVDAAASAGRETDGWPHGSQLSQPREQTSDR
jgi:hypothetical protein